MKKVIKNKWIKELRSGNYQKLEPQYPYMRYDNKYAAFGILVKLFVDFGIISEYDAYYITSPHNQQSGRVMDYKSWPCKKVCEICNISPSGHYIDNFGKWHSLSYMHWLDLSFECQAEIIEKTFPSED